ncbi:hypothetical protein [Faecalicatena contorta]|uniref:Lipoprotein n=1 Tax=Faecalicatena contorta TaxID=39482 RepID=A0A315ZMT7_9FIRM|nr:hypothetical protein [Faecalicatena contorta]PWJ46881.1 hypothetical protein A8805_12616 [Faecalicatena contorta]SUQ16307.1 hypothetical protein SAMN05216529_12616 [Faecalicatena contorta]
MRMKQVTAIIMAAAICFVFAACQSNNSNNNDKKVKEVSEENTPALEENESNTGESEADMQVVGTDEFGYVSIPGEWVEFFELDGGADFQYSNVPGTSIITLNVFDDGGMPEEEKNQLDSETVASHVWYNLENNGVTDIVGARVTLNGYDAVQVYGSFISEDHSLPSSIVCWIVEGEQGVFHYISAEGGLDDIGDVVSYVENSYSLENPNSI